MKTLFCFGLGYTSQVLARRKQAAGWRVIGTARTDENVAHLREKGFEAFIFGDPRLIEILNDSTHLLASIPPGPQGDPALLAYGDILKRRSDFDWIGYLSTIGVYGDHQGRWIDETTEPDRADPRARMRLDAEAGWLEIGRNAHVFRLGGIYGPGRNPLVALTEGSARRIVKPGQVFNRVHVDDIATVLEASIDQPRHGGIYNVVDGEPSAPEEPVSYAASLLNVSAPPETSVEEADLSPMGRTFYAANRRVDNRAVRCELGVSLAYPNYRRGLDALFEAFKASSSERPHD